MYLIYKLDFNQACFLESKGENMTNTKIDVISGFLGAGKTTFIKRLVEGNKDKGKTIIIENEFGEIGIDGGFLKNSGIEIKEMNSGCICCSLAGDFEASLRELLEKYSPNRVIIEPSGVGKLSDVLKAVSDVEKDLPVESNSAVTVVDVKKCKMYMKNFGEFFNNQIQFANTIILSRTDLADDKKIEEAVALIKGVNPDATIVTTTMTNTVSMNIITTMTNTVSMNIITTMTNTASMNIITTMTNTVSMNIITTMTNTASMNIITTIMTTADADMITMTIIMQTMYLTVGVWSRYLQSVKTS